MMAIPAVHDGRMAEFSDFVTAQTGLYFPQTAWRDLQRAAAAAASELGLPDAAACIRWLLTPPVTPRHIQALARHLTVGETYFFREKPALDALEQRILPELIQARRGTTRQLRIWSAACCTGEEPYTLAIILSRLLPNWKDWDITILGTDINSHFLELAARGVYRNWSFRATPASIKERYFTPPERAVAGDDGGYAINPEIKHMVTFAQLNLADTGYPSLSTNTTNMDVIFCRNALMYFSPETLVRVVGNFHKTLASGGWLVVNPSEATPALFAQYELVAQPDAILFRKGSGGTRTPSESAAQTASGARGGVRSQTMDDGRQTASGARGVSKAPTSPPLSIVHRPSSAAGLPPASPPAAGPDFARLAAIEANQGRLHEALALSEQAIQADKTNPAYWYLRATILQEQGALGEAIAALKRVLYLDPGFVLAHFVLGNIALQAMRKPEAIKHFNTARAQLKNHKQDDVLPGSEDLTAGQLEALITRTED
jgi:chemotaxis protein methyltransferase CheR